MLDVITCIHCRQSHSDDRHECLKTMSMEEVMELPEDVVNHLLRREYRARFLQAIFEPDSSPFSGMDRSVDHRRLADFHQDLTRESLLDAIALARRRMIKDLEEAPDTQEAGFVASFDAMAMGMVERLFPEPDQG